MMLEARTLTQGLQEDLAALKRKELELTQQLKHVKAQISALTGTLKGTGTIIGNLAWRGRDFDAAAQQLIEIFSERGREEAIKDPDVFQRVWETLREHRVKNVLLRAHITTFEQMSAQMENPAEWYAIRHMGPATSAVARSVLHMLGEFKIQE